MTREAFIRKWCCTGYGYTEEKRDEMRDDLDAVIDWANSSINNNPLGIANVIKSVCPVCWFPLEDGIVKNMCVNEQCPRNGGQTVL